MKKIPLLLVSAAVLLVVACPHPWNPVTAPTTFTQKVLLEEATGTWCGYCPDGAAVLETIMDGHPGAVIGAAYHVGDAMEVEETSLLAAGLGEIPYYPSGAMNRSTYAGNPEVDAPIFMSRDYWSAAVNQILADTAKCGLKLVTDVTGNKATIRVSIGFPEVLTGDIRLSVFVTEDNVTGYTQTNYYTEPAATPYYGAGSITDYVFMHVVRGYVTPVTGEKIDFSALDDGGGISRELAYLIPEGAVLDNLNAVAIVHHFGPNPEDNSILNAQEVRIGETKDWD